VFMTWTNHVVLGQVLFPGMTNGMTAIFTDPSSSGIFDGLMSGSLLLLGDVRYQDVDSHDYEIIFKAIRTNSQFEIICLDLRGRFREFFPNLPIK
jgi:hypothetical protein